MADAVAAQRRPASGVVALAMLGLGTFAIGTDSHIVIGVLDLPETVLAEPGVAERILELGSSWADERLPGPSRAELLDLVG